MDLRLTGLVAPIVLDGPTSGRSFQTYVEHVLVPALRPGDVVVMDNFCSHKGAAVQAAIVAAEASLLFLPPYTPDFNSIGRVLSKLKAHLRRAAERTRDGQ